MAQLTPPLSVLTDQSFVCDQSTSTESIEDSDWEVEFSVETNNAGIFFDWSTLSSTFYH